MATASTTGVIIAHCGLCCTNCGMYRKGKCEGCHGERPMNRRCKMKACSLSRGYANCAECAEFEDLRACKKLNNVVANFFGFVFRTDRIGNLERIREVGLEAFKREKAADDRP